MRRHTLVTLTWLLTTVLMSLPVTAGFCHQVDGEGSSTLTPEDYEGSGSLTIDGRTYRMEFTGINLAFTETEDDGTVHAVTSTDWTTPANGVKLTTFEDARLDPTDEPGVFLYVGRSRVETGNGRYNCGELVVQGQVDFNTGLGSFTSMRGKFCRCD